VSRGSVSKSPGSGQASYVPCEEAPAAYPPELADTRELLAEIRAGDLNVGEELCGRAARGEGPVERGIALSYELQI